jgi:hypothetical protein
MVIIMVIGMDIGVGQQPVTGPDIQRVKGMLLPTTYIKTVPMV